MSQSKKMKIFRNKKNGKLYYIYQIVRSMCLCGDNKHIAYPYRHDGKTIEVWKNELNKKFEVVAHYNGLPF